MKTSKLNRMAAALACGACVFAANTGMSAVSTITLYAKAVTNTMPDGVQVPMWGFTTSPTGTPTSPGPRISINPNQIGGGLQVTLVNQLSEPVSIVIPGMSGSVEAGQPTKFAGDPNYGNRVRSLVPEVPPGGTRVYTWNGPLKMGTYVYHSGSHPAVQVQMGLFGMVTVRDSGNQVYPGVAIPNNQDVPVIFSEIDPALHWAVQTNDYGVGKDISSTMHSDPRYFLINGVAFNPLAPNLGPNGSVGAATLFRMINVCWDARIPVLGGPFPSSGGNYVRVIAEDANPYTYEKVVYAPNLPAMKTMDVIFTPTLSGRGNNNAYRLYDHRLGLANGLQPDGGMFVRWNVN